MSVNTVVTVSLFDRRSVYASQRDVSPYKTHGIIRAIIQNDAENIGQVR